MTGPHPRPWPDTGVDLRYWSACTNLQLPVDPVVVNHLPDGGVDYGCRHDDTTTLDSGGYYTYAIGTEAQRASIEQIGGVTFLPFSSQQPRARHLVVLRNMLPNDAFTAAIQRAPEDGRAASAKVVMGPYYPEAAVCPLATLAARGPAGCIAQP